MLPGLACAALIGGLRPGPIALSAPHDDVISAASSAYESGGAKTYTVPGAARTLRLNLSVTPTYFSARYRKNLAASVAISDGATLSIANGDTLWFGFESATIDDSTVVTITDTLRNETVDSVGLVFFTI